MNELISVIVPVYNVEKYLAECIESIIKQTYHNLEIILVNDGSTDSSEEIMHQYARLDSRIICISKKNGGPSSSRNAGLRTACGTYVIFIDSDDYLEEGMIEYLYHMMDHQVNVAVCGYTYVDDSGQALPPGIPREEVFPEESIYSEPEFWDIYFEKSRVYCVVVWNKLIRKEAIGELEFPLGEDPDVPLGIYHEDEIFVTGLWKQNIIMKCSPEKLYNYRVRNNGRALYISVRQHGDNIDAYIDRLFYFADRKMYHELSLIFDSILDLLYEMFGLQEQGNELMVSNSFRNVRNTANRVIFLPVSLKTKLKAAAFYVMGRYYYALRTFVRKMKKEPDRA